MCESCDSAARRALEAVPVIQSTFSLRSASLRRGARKKMRACASLAGARPGGSVVGGTRVAQ
eukprot:5785357-Alexandrium_andersonii.AAC.1